MSKYRATNVKEHLRNGVLLRNPVLVQAIGLFPVVAVATSVSSALLFAIVSAIILIIMETLTSLILKHLPPWLRIGFYAILSFLIIIPAMMLCNKFFADKLSPAAVFLPILSVNALVSYRCEKIAYNSGFITSFWDAVTTSLGYGAVLLTVGFIRELLGKGSILGYSIPNFPTVSGLLMPFGGFIILGFMAAALRWGMARRYDYEATETAVDHIREEELEEKNGLKNLFGITKSAISSKPNGNSDKDGKNKAPARDTDENQKATAKADKKAKRAADNKAAAEKRAAQKANFINALTEKTDKIKAEKEAKAEAAEKKRLDKKLETEKIKESQKLEKAAKPETKKKAQEDNKNKPEPKAKKQKTRKPKKPTLPSKPSAPKSDSKKPSVPPVPHDKFYDENDFDFDFAWGNYQTRLENNNKNNDKEEPNA